MKQSDVSSFKKIAPTLGALNLKNVLTTNTQTIDVGRKQSEKITQGYKDDCLSSNSKLDDDRFTVDKLIFASGEKDKNGIIVIGSLYFKDGFRIRLCHRGGPGVSEHKTTTQYCLKNDEATNRFNFLADPIYDIPVIKMALEQLDEDSDEFDVVKALGEKRTIKDWLARIEALEDREKTPREIEQTLFEEGRIELAGENVSGTLLEIDDDNVHISAGGPVPVPSDMNQNRLNALLRAANTGNNVAMQLCFEHVAKN